MAKFRRIADFGWFPGWVLALGLVFLYAPLGYVVIYSFNASRMVTVWAGFSTAWYGALLRDGQLLEAGWISLQVALAAATGAVLLGTLAGLVLGRFRRFVGRTLFFGMVSAPLIMPEIILGISSLLLFVSLEQTIGWPAGRGISTLILAHITFSLSFVAIVVQSRLGTLDPSLEEAAQDLGATPVVVFFRITLPLILPALISGWLLAFSLSLEDVVISSFVSGPGSTTLPLVILSKVRLGLNPEVNALATIIIAVVALAGFVNLSIQRRRA